MQVIINGEQKTLGDETKTIAELLQASGVEAVEMVTVQRNGEFVERDQFATLHLVESDEVDFLYFMGGGSQ